MSVYIGTSGYDYVEWRGHFYPEELPRARFLSHYSTRLNACELNATFYGRQTDKAVKRWYEGTPDDFVFCAKAHMRITHTKQMAPDEETREFTRSFVDSLAGLGEKLRVVLFQIPAFRERDDQGLENLLRSLPAERRYAFEFKSPSWDSPEVRKMLEQSGAAMCLDPGSAEPPGSAVGGAFGYVRLRAPGYSETQKTAWLRLLERDGVERDVFVFARHKGIEPGDHSAGVRFASWLKEGLDV